MINIQKIANLFLALFFIGFAISPAFALGEGNRNLILIGIMCLSPILIVGFNSLQRSDIWLIIFLIGIIIIPLVNQPQSIRWSTILYSCMFGLTFMAYTRLLYAARLSHSVYIKFLKYLIIAYTITLIIQQFCVLTGLPIFNVSNYDTTVPWKLNSLSAEPSHSARIVALLTYSYLFVKQILLRRSYHFKNDFSSDKWIWLGFFWIVMTSGSATGFLFLTIIMLKFLNFKNLFPLILISTLIFALINSFEISAANRAYQTFYATLTFDEASIIEADHSGSIRIVPIIILIKLIDFSTIDSWLGHGIDYVSTFLSYSLPGLQEGMSSGGLMVFCMEYGFLLLCIYFL